MADMTLESVRQSLSGALLTIRWWTPTRALSSEAHCTAADALAADRQWLSAASRVIDTKHPAWRELCRVRTVTRAYWEDVTLPYCVQGQRLFRIDQRAEIMDTLVGKDQRMVIAACALDIHREDLLAQAKQRLGSAFDLTAYPDRWAGRFRVEIREVSIDPPSYLRWSDSEEYQRQLQRRLEDIASSLARYQQDVMVGLARTAGRLAVNLQEGGKIQASNLDSFARIFDRVSRLRFEGSAAFQIALEDARALVGGLTADDLRRKAGLRDETRTRLAALTARLGQLLRGADTLADGQGVDQGVAG